MNRTPQQVAEDCSKRYSEDRVVELYQAGHSIAEIVGELGGMKWEELYVGRIVKRRGLMRTRKETIRLAFSRGRIFRPSGPAHWKYQGYQYSKSSPGHQKIRPEGYVLLYVSKGEYVRRNRLVWEQANGPIPEGCEIHHLNGIKDDDRLENLACLSKAGHTRIYLRLLEQAQLRIRILEGQLRKRQDQLKFDLGK